MPPNKKKKKAANPARGFATTSTISKSRLNGEVVEDVTTISATVSDDHQPHNQTASNKLISSSQGKKELSELSPEQLEQQLEESELQILVDQFGEKSRKDALRQVSRIQTERRLLRSQAEQLNTTSLLPMELLGCTLMQIQVDSNTESKPVKVQNGFSSKSMRSDDLSIKVWTLARALRDLGFLESGIRTAITKLVRNYQTGDLSDIAVGKQSLWGFDRCLDSLALDCSLEELPEYESSRTEISKSSTLGFAVHEEIAEIATPKPVSTGFGNTAALEYDSGDDSRQSTNESGSDDTNDDPRYALERYLALQRRLFAKEPDLTVIDRHRPHNKAKEDRNVPQRDAETKRLLRKIKTLQADILFDKAEAHERWSELRLALLKEIAERKRLQLSVRETEKRYSEETTPNSDSTQTAGTSNQEGLPPSTDLTHPEMSDTAGRSRIQDPSNTSDDHDPVLGLGEFFSSLPVQEINTESGGSIMTTISNGETVTIRDFGKWTGMNPRRIFEEACKARDSSCKIKFVHMSSSSSSSQHSVIVRWSQNQQLPSLCLTPTVNCLANRKTVRLDMVGLSTPDVAQSEAYISTVALFVVFIASPKEEKAHLRLPAIWKDLWNELCDARKENTDRIDRQELQDIRKMIDETYQAVPNTSRVSANYNEVSGEGRNTVDSNSLIPTAQIQDTAGESLRAIWKDKISTEAYTRMLEQRIRLPIWDFRNQLLSAIDSNQVVIICGETGCGKSTQVPALILEHELSCARSCKIYCTEPRRISAISLARRVSEELGERKGEIGTSRSLVGYAIRLESHITAGTRLVYATTGIVMRMLERGNDLEDITHLILDEVHERTIDSDFLLIVLRKLMVRRPDLKVILMSATVNAEQFSQYLAGAPIVNVPGRTYPVETKYLEDVIETTSYRNAKDATRAHSQLDEDDEEDALIEKPSRSNPNTSLQAYSKNTRLTLSQFDEYHINYDLILNLLEAIATKPVYTVYSKAILVFLPGIAEIRRLNDMLSGHPTFSNGWYTYPLHSTIATEEQERAFLVPPTGIRKIVLATNIAETGITIPDVTCVVDAGKHKEMRFDERRQLSRLIESFISRANAKQRRGRAGRVQNGLCFHLFTKARHDSLMAEQQTPEMLRLSLQDLVLRVKICKLGAIDQTLTEALDPPLPKNIRRAIDSLIDVKALTTGEDLTLLGRQLAKLPLDVFLGKLILLGSIFKCLDAMLTIAAILSSKSPFSAPMGARSQADLARLAFKRGDSDLLTVYNAYCAWRRVCKTTGLSEYQFCRKNFLSPQTLSNIEDLKAQLTTSLIDAGFLVLDDAEKAALNRARFYSHQRHFVSIPASHDTNFNNDLALESVIAWSFYPKLLVRDGKGWRNIVSNQSVSLYPTSVNKRGPNPPKWLSFYHIMQSNNKFYNAHETSAVEDFAIALVCGDADFKMYAGVIVIDGNRLRFAVSDWKIMLCLKMLRTRLREIIAQSFRTPGRSLSPQQQTWFDIWQRMFSQESLFKDKSKG